MEHVESLGEIGVRFIQPYQARKDYVCPGCNRIVPSGVGHFVVVPVEAPDLRRHWHRACWTRKSKLIKRRSAIIKPVAHQKTGYTPNRLSHD